MTWNIAGVVIDNVTDWDELDELLRDSYRELAPGKLADLATSREEAAPVAATGASS